MADLLTLALVLVFVAVAVLTGLTTSVIMARTSTERRRLRGNHVDIDPQAVRVQADRLLHALRAVDRHS